DIMKQHVVSASFDNATADSVRAFAEKGAESIDDPGGAFASIQASLGKQKASISLSAKVTQYAEVASNWARANRGRESIESADALNQVTNLAKGLDGMYLSEADSATRETAALEVLTILNDMLCGSATNTYSASVAELKEVATIASACKTLRSQVPDDEGMEKLSFVILFTENLDLADSLLQYMSLPDGAAARVKADKTLAITQEAVAAFDSLLKAAAGAASTRLEQWQVALRCRLTAQAEIDLPARRQKLDESAIPIERLQFGTARGELWSGGLAADAELDQLLARATDSILADYTAPLTVKNHAVTLSTRETEWTAAAKLYQQHDQTVTEQYQKMVMHTKVRVSEATCLMALKEFSGRPMKLKRLLSSERDELAASGWWGHVQPALRAQVEDATKWSRKAAGA
ncbi:unnamed protein product, partial [Prorocentrum cordatum]